MELKENMQLKKGKYTILSKLGQGGFGITYLAKTVAEVEGKVGGKSKKMKAYAQVVIKEFFLRDYCERGEDNQSVNVISRGKTDLVTAYRKKFKKEALNLSRMSHPNIVEVTDVIEDENNTSYYVMRFLSGGNLYDIVRPADKETKPLSEARAIRYVKQVADALGYMHQRMMCHFDVKPNNIMLDEEDDAVLIDFGLAKNYSKNGKQISTLVVGAAAGYAPLEQVNANLETFSPQTDIYALGATLYFLLTGQNPHPANFDINIVLPKGQCGISDHLWEVIQKCMEANPKDRPANIDAFLNLLDDKKEEIPTRPMPQSLIERNSFWDKIAHVFQRNRKFAAWLTCSILGVAGLIYGVRYFNFPDDNPTAVSGGEVVNKDSVKTDEQFLPHLSSIPIIDASGKLLYHYYGMVIEDIPTGHGTATYPENDPEKKEKFVGNFENGKRLYGTLSWKSGNTYTGSFENDMLMEGKFTSKDSSYYEGTFNDNKPWNGTWYNKDGSIFKKVVNGKVI